MSHGRQKSKQRPGFVVADAARLSHGEERRTREVKGVGRLAHRKLPDKSKLTSAQQEVWDVLTKDPASARQIGEQVGRTRGSAVSILLALQGKGRAVRDNNTHLWRRA